MWQHFANNSFHSLIYCMKIRMTTELLYWIELQFTVYIFLDFQTFTVNARWVIYCIFVVNIQTNCLKGINWQPTKAAMRTWWRSEQVGLLFLLLLSIYSIAAWEQHPFVSQPCCSSASFTTADPADRCKNTSRSQRVPSYVWTQTEASCLLPYIYTSYCLQMKLMFNWWKQKVLTQNPNQS